jgi:hypothetical protein
VVVLYWNRKWTLNIFKIMRNLNEKLNKIGVSQEKNGLFFDQDKNFKIASQHFLV